MTDDAKGRRLLVQEHPSGRIELTPNVAYTASHRRRGLSDGDISELFHENSKFDERYLHRSSLTKQELPADISAVAHDYTEHESVALPEPNPVDCGLGDILGRRRSLREYSDRGVTRQELGTILGLSVKPTCERIDGPVTETFRPYPSAGGLFPVEVYLFVSNGRDLPSGLYYYSPHRHVLRVLDRGVDAAEFESTFVDADFSRQIVSGSPVTVVLTGAFPRAKAKYGPVGYRFTLFEAGHLAQNLLLTAEGIGMGGVPLGSFLDDPLDEFLGVHGVDESALYPIAVGHPKNDA